MSEESPAVLAALDEAIKAAWTQNGVTTLNTAAWERLVFAILPPGDPFWKAATQARRREG